MNGFVQLATAIAIGGAALTHRWIAPCGNAPADRQVSPAFRGVESFLAAFFIATIASVPVFAQSPSLLLNPNAPEMNQRAPDLFDVHLETSKGKIQIEVHRDWSPHGADRFYNLVRAGYYDGDRFFRVIHGRWAQVGISGDPKISSVWRTQTIPDDPRRESNVRGTVAFAFAVTNGRTTQIFINLRDNSATHDPENFAPFGKVIAGMDAADALDSEYGETSGSGIRAGKQEPLFQMGNAYLEKNFPQLDFIRHAAIIETNSESK